VERRDGREWASEEQLAVRLAVRRCLADLTAGETVLVACSGGPDSTALAAATGVEGSRAGRRVGAVVVDHGLQDGSGERAEASASWLRANGLGPVDVVRVRVAAGGGPEDAARRARYEALAAAADRHSAAVVLLGHTRDDQAETVLLGLARGSGARSLAGMPATRDRYRRPLLALDRATVRAAVPAGAPVWEDPHNVDPAYRRSRVRARVLPVLEAELGPGVAAALARTADLLRADADALDRWAGDAYADLADDAGLELSRLAALPTAVRTRVLRWAALDAGAPAGALTAAHVTALDAMVTDWHGQGSPALPGPLVAHRSGGRLTLSRGRAPRT
jgi:tRNA(Ile)-lysidine synthase